jgi:phenylacetate-CoA ligase
MDVKDTIFFLKQAIRPGVIKCFKKLTRDQYLSADELASINWIKRKALLAHAFEHVPFYAALYREAGLHPQDIKTDGDWSSLPIVRKEHLRNGLLELKARNVSKEDLRLVTTGGSTGEPVRVFHDQRFPVETIGWRMLEWWGVSPADNAAYCWRLVRSNWGEKALNSLMWWPTRRIWFDASNMTISAASRFLKEFNSLKPVVFQGYTGSVDYLAQYIIDNKISIVSPKCVWGTSSPVSATQRSNIEKAFGAPLYDQYGCSEVYWLAGQCREKEGLHFFYDVRHIEFVSDEGATLPLYDLGNVVITDLENYGFPLIRYINGDVGRFLPGKCACGVSLPLIAPVKGRTTDLVKMPNGGAIGGDYITTLFDHCPDAVSAFQVRQFADYSITVYVVPSADRLAATVAVNGVVEMLRSRTNGSVEVNCKLVSEIESERGKTRYVLSEAS